MLLLTQPSAAWWGLLNPASTLLSAVAALPLCAHLLKYLKQYFLTVQDEVPNLRQIKEMVLNRPERPT